MDTVEKGCTTCTFREVIHERRACGPCFASGWYKDWQLRPGVAHALLSGKGERQTVPAPDLCVDEGCEHHGTPHVCNSVPAVPPKVISDGGSTGYYKLPAGAADLQDLIEHKQMSFGRGNIFKATYRLGEKDAATEEYDLRKIIWFAERRLKELGKAR